MSEKGCILEEGIFRDEMWRLIKSGANNPYSINMGDWYYIKDHAQECEHCMNLFERLAEEARKDVNFDGPTTLRK